MSEPAKLDSIVERYIALRDRKSEMKKEYDSKVAAIDEGLEKIENFMLKHLQSTGSSSIRTEAGTFFKQVVTKASVADKDTFMSYVRDNDLWALLEVRASKSAVDQFRTEHNDLPPGINWTETLTVNVRRS